MNPGHMLAGQGRYQKTIDRAMQCQRGRDLASAERLYRQVLAKDPSHLVALHLLSGILIETRRYEDAVVLLRRATSRAPDQAQAIFFANLGEAHRRMGEAGEATAALRRAIALKFDLAEAHYTLGLTQSSRGHLDEALASFNRAIAFKPSLADAYNQAGIVLKEQGRVEEALASFRRALAENPGHRVAHSNLIFLLGWSKAQEAAAVAREAIRWQKQHVASGVSTRVHSNEPRPSNEPSSDRRLRVGYVSPNFREHCQAFFFIPLLENHDRTAVEVFCYSFAAEPDDVTRRIRSLADEFRDIRTMNDPDAAAIIRADRVDVLVDLTMHMGDNRLALFAHRPAPVQVAWLAYPGTTGLDAMDYRITDPFLDPPDIDIAGHYTEYSVRLPDSFWCYDPLTRDPVVGGLPARANGKITFGCLNNFGKTNPDVFALWARVLREVDDSRLLLLAHPGNARARVRDALRRGGVDPDRIEFVGFQERRDYLATYSRIDIGLDTFPVNGHTTSLDSFWMGVPVVSLVGHTALGRAGLCYAHHLGLADLVAKAPEDYVATAAALARDLSRLERLRTELRSRLEGSPLMNGALFARHFEAACRWMWRRWCSDSGISADPGAPSIGH